MNVRRQGDIAVLREGGSILAQALRTVVQAATAGVTTAELNHVAEREIRAHGAEPSFLGYRDYPATLCVSRNNEVVHGIPSAAISLHSGDIVGLDLGVRYKGFITDMAVTVGIGAIKPEAQRLLDVTRTALNKAVAFLKPGVTTGDLGALLQAYIEGEGFSVIRDLVGHGVGLQVHEEPMIPNFGVAGQGTALTEGMVIAVEPMVTAGDWHVKVLEDGWTVATADGGLGAHFEHTLLITADGVDVLTKTNGKHPWP